MLKPGKLAPPPRSAVAPCRHRRRIHCWLALALCGVLPGLALAQQRMPVDPARSHLGFEIRTRFGQKISGVFHRFDGELIVLADGRHQVRLRMYTDQVDILGKPRYTALIRGKDFFDVERYPVVEFDSLPYPSTVIEHGGDIVGSLTLHGERQLETLTVMPAQCQRPGYDCEVISRGTIQRGRYKMNKWQVALSDRVTLVVRARLLEATQP